MARPPKQGLEYFALDVMMDDETELIEAVHGLVGFAIIIKLFQKIYSEGYFIKWRERDQILFANRVSDDRNRVTSVVSDCVRWGIFNKEKYDEHEILTSRRIQDHYFTVTYKRVNVIAIKEYLLIDVTDKGHVAIQGVSDDGNPATTTNTVGRNQATTPVSGVQSTQSKSKSKSKSNLSTESKSSTEQLPSSEGVLNTGRAEAPKRSKDRSTPKPEPKPFIQMTLNDGTQHGVTYEELTRYKELYPAVNVEQQLRAMVGWLEANPTKRKTKTGIRRFIANWLNREQNQGSRGGNGNARPEYKHGQRVIGDNRYFLPREEQLRMDKNVTREQKEDALRFVAWMKPKVQEEEKRLGRKLEGMEEAHLRNKYMDEYEKLLEEGAFT